ncbi:hypothetical protein [Methylobacter sp.]|uniref:hypothetical protein n=1 Tax=Methylobacter sp. TaxID=2051955 RepID=UPI002FDD2955
MFSISNQIINQILLTSLLRFLFISGSFSFIVGVGLIFYSEMMFRMFEKMNSWVSFRRQLRILEITRDSWPSVQRYRYVLAVFITAGAVYAANRLITQVDTEVAVPWISSGLHLPEVYVSWLLVSVKWFLLLGCVIGIAVGLMLAFSLSTLSKIEAFSNTWISTRDSNLNKKAEVMQVGVDKFVMSFPKTVGLVVAVMSMVEVTLVGMQMH